MSLFKFWAELKSNFLVAVLVTGSYSIIVPFPFAPAPCPTQYILLLEANVSLASKLLPKLLLLGASFIE